MKILFAAMLLSSICLVNAQAPKLKWTDCYSDTAVGNLVPKSFVTDSKGNSYVTGYIGERYPNYYNYHFFITRYNSAGVQQWTKTYPVTNIKTDKLKFDAGVKLCVDNKGYVYVTGYRFDTICGACSGKTNFQYEFVMRLDSSGKLKWAKLYDGDKNTLQTPSDMVVDTTAGQQSFSS